MERRDAFYAARDVLDEMLARRKAAGGPFSNADLELILAHPNMYVKRSTRVGATSALLARRAVATHQEARYLGLEAVQTETGWSKIAYVLDATQTVLAVIDEHEESLLSGLFRAKYPGDRPQQMTDQTLADSAQPDLLSVEQAFAYGTPVSWWDVVVRGK